jgi:hypothetical protein
VGGVFDMSVDLDATRKLRADARKRLVKGLCERLPKLVEELSFYQIDGDSYSAYEIVDVHSFRVVMSVKADDKKLGKPRRAGE